jgi:hypothetical protein
VRTLLTATPNTIKSISNYFDIASRAVIIRAHALPGNRAGQLNA